MATPPGPTAAPGGTVAFSLQPARDRLKAVSEKWLSRVRRFTRRGSCDFTRFFVFSQAVHDWPVIESSSFSCAGVRRGGLCQEAPKAAPIHRTGLGLVDLAAMAGLLLAQAGVSGGHALPG